MSDFVRMDYGDTGGSSIPIHSAAAAASLSMADANIDGVKLYHNINKVSMNDRIMTWIIGTLAMAAVSVGIFAMWVEASLVTYIAFVIPMVTGPMVVVQRKKLQWMPTLREESNKIRLSVNELALQRLKLELEVGRMERQVRRMKEVEQRFEYLVQREGRSVEEFRALIRENSRIQAEIKKSHAARELLDLFSVIMTTDRNEDNVVSSLEAQEFILRVRDFAGRRGKLLNEELILDAFKHSMNNPNNSHCPASMFNIVQTALSDELEVPPKNNDEEEDPDKDYYVPPDDEFVEDGFVKLQKVPRVAPTGLVLSDSNDDEGNLSHPIKVEDLMAEQGEMMESDVVLPITQHHTASFSSSDSNNNSILSPMSTEEEGADIVSMILRSFSDMRSS